MSDNNKQRRKKNERRQKRLKKRERQQAARDVRLQTVTCGNCGERYGAAEDPEVVHRAGPCDCTPEALQAMQDFLDARSEAFENAKDGKIACVTCGTMHGEAEQATCFFEGRLVWDGCDNCFEAQAAKFESIREDHRERWFGARLKPIVSQITPVTSGKYVPPVVRRESISDVPSIYAGAFSKPKP